MKPHGVTHASVWDNRHRSHDGSVLLLVLFVCLAITVVVQTLVAVVMCTTRAIDDEIVGRTLLAERDMGLAILRQWAAADWGILPWTELSEDGQTLEGCLSEVAGEIDWVVQATVRQEHSVCRQEVAAWVERGRDGLDLPLAAVVAGSLMGSPDREEAWLANEAIGHVVSVPGDALLEPGCALLAMAECWRLDSAWGRMVTAEQGDGVAPGEGVALLHHPPGFTETIPEDFPGGRSDQPGLVVVTGGADLDVERHGDFHGVLVVDGGAVSLEGTTLYGAVFATGTVDLGRTGRIVFDRVILRWATDRSFVRTRLLPGSRREGTE